MKGNKQVVSHYIPRRPEPGLWFVRSDGEPKRSKEYIDSLYESGRLVKLNPEVEISSKQTLFLGPEGEIIVADSVAGCRDPQQLVIAVEGTDEHRERLADKVGKGRVTAETVRNTEIPEEMGNLAYFFKARMDTLRHETMEVIDQEQYALHECEYTNIDEGLKTLRESLRAYLYENTELLGEPIKQDYHYFEIGLESWRTQNERSICTYPFFLSKVRRSYWGVIPYGKQTHFGILLHKKHPSYAEDILALQPTEGQRGAIDIDEVHKCLIRLVYNTIHMNDGLILSFHGYILGELIADIVKTHGNELELKMFKHLWRKRSKQQTETSEIRVLPEEMKSDRKSIVFFFDPGELDEIQSNCTHNYQPILLPHGLDIPVGIGFNLCMLPYLIKQDCWRKLREIAGKELGPWTAELEKAGIALDAPFRSDSPRTERLEETDAATDIP